MIWCIILSVYGAGVLFSLGLCVFSRGASWLNVLAIALLSWLGAGLVLCHAIEEILDRFE